jgi:hypothetical protein
MPKSCWAWFSLPSGIVTPAQARAYLPPLIRCAVARRLRSLECRIEIVRIARSLPSMALDARIPGGMTDFLGLDGLTQ